MGNNLTKKNLKLFFLLQFLHFILNTDQKNPKLINFTKWIKLGSIVEQIVNLQQSPYNLQPIKPLMDYLLAACGFENHETSAYKFSKLIEPDNQNDQKHNFSQTFSPRVFVICTTPHIHQSNSSFWVQLISPVYLGKIYSLHLLIILLGMPLLLSSSPPFVFSRSVVPSSLPPFYT